MAKSRKALREEVKAVYVADLAAYFEEKGEEVLQVKSNELAIPVVDAEGNEDFIVLTVRIPTGANKGTEPYDGYAMAQEYEMKQVEKAAKAKEAAEKKAAKIKRDAERRAKEAQIHSKQDLKRLGPIKGPFFYI